MTSDLDPQDAKLVTLARASMARIGEERGAAVRDADGRLYAAGPVNLPSLQLEPLELAVAQAVSSGATGLEAAAVVVLHTDALVELDVVRDLAGEGIPVYVADATGAVIRTLHS